MNTGNVLVWHRDCGFYSHEVVYGRILNLNWMSFFNSKIDSDSDWNTGNVHTASIRLKVVSLSFPSILLSPELVLHTITCEWEYLMNVMDSGMCLKGIEHSVGLLKCSSSFHLACLGHLRSFSVIFSHFQLLLLFFLILAHKTIIMVS